MPLVGDLLAVSAGRKPVLLILRALGLGDLLTAVPALRALGDAFPGHHRVLAAPPALARLLPLLQGDVHELLPAAPLQPVAGAGRADVGVNLHGRGPDSHRALLAGRPRRLIAFEHPDFPLSHGMPRHHEQEHEVHRWCRLLAETGVPSDPTRLEIAVPDLPIRSDARGATVLHPGAADPARRWPADRWAEVARRERAAGRVVLVTGSRRESALARSVAAAAGLDADSVCAGRTDLLELAALVAAAGRVVSGDTGIAHLAVALRTPSVTLFGPTPPALWGPPPERPQHIALWAGRSGDPHGATTDPGLLAIGVAEVVAALDRTATGPRSDALRSA